MSDQKNIFADGTCVTIMFVMGMVIGVGIYIKELNAQLHRSEQANKILATQVVEQQQVLDLLMLSRYNETQPSYKILRQ